jgi:enoyl-CoA hydratase/carnithine racemase
MSTATTTSSVVYEKQEDIAFVRFNRPEVRNAVGAREARLCVEHLQRASADDGVAGVIVGSTTNTFAAGADLREMVQELEDIASGKLTVTDIIEGVTEDWMEVARVMRSAKKPVIASVAGYAVGAGCEVALDCDLVVADETAVFGFPESHAGMSITGGVTKLLAQSIGMARARDLVLTGRFVDAREALEIGLINRVVPAGENDAAAVELVRQLQRHSPLSIIAHKRMLQQAADMDIESVYNLEKQNIGVLLTTEDAVEASKAFIEKRDPVFKGR